MNDLDELRYGMNLGIKIFPEFAKIASKNDIKTEEHLISAFYHYIGHMSEKTLADTYILCFAEHNHDNNDGLLSMWRSYANQGHGAAIVFNSQKIPRNEAIPLRIAKVIYLDNQEREKLLKDYLLKWAQITSLNKLTGRDLDHASYAAFLFVKGFSLIVKHKGFSEEKEWRIIYTPEGDLNHFMEKYLSAVILDQGAEPKLKLDIKDMFSQFGIDTNITELIEFVILGPSSSSPIAKSAFCRAISGSVKNANDFVRSSNIPLRPSVKTR